MSRQALSDIGSVGRVVNSSWRYVEVSLDTTLNLQDVQKKIKK